MVTCSWALLKCYFSISKVDKYSVILNMVILVILSTAVANFRQFISGVPKSCCMHTACILAGISEWDPA